MSLPQILCTLVPLLGFIACTRHPSSSIPAPPTWVRWAIAKEPHDLHWTNCVDKGCEQFSTMIMEGLTRFDSTQSRFVGALAEKWQFTTPHTIEITLRDNLRWSNGHALTMNEVITPWKHILKQCDTHPLGAFFRQIQNGEAFCRMKVPFASVGIKLVNFRVIRITFEPASRAHLVPEILSYPSTWPTPSQHTSKRFSHVTLGAFRVHRWNQGDSIILLPNPNYHGASVPYAGIEIKIVANPQIRLQLFDERQVDILDDITPELVGRLTGQLPVQSYPTYPLFAAVFNTHSGLFQAQPIRKLFADAIDKSEMSRLLKEWLIPIRFLKALPIETARDSSSTDPTELMYEKALKDHHIEKPQTILLAVALPQQARTDNRLIEKVLLITNNLRAQWIKRLGQNVELSLDNVLSPMSADVTLVLFSNLYDAHRSCIIGDFRALFAVDQKKTLDLALEKCTNATSYEQYFQESLQLEKSWAVENSLIVPLVASAKYVLAKQWLQNLTVDHHAMVRILPEVN